MHSLLKHPVFPAAWIVLAAVAPFIALAGMYSAHMIGVEMTSHTTSFAGATVKLLVLVVMAVSTVIEVCAICIGIAALWKRRDLRTTVNFFVLFFAAVTFFCFMVAIEFPSPWLR